jgi:site-specific DNA-adenine methylase
VSTPTRATLVLEPQCFAHPPSVEHTFNLLRTVEYKKFTQIVREYAPKYGKTKDSSQARDNVVDISRKVRDVNFDVCSYERFSNLRNFIIYCDPPYESTNNVYYSKNKKIGFSHVEFWNWCRDMSRYNIVFVSGYSAPKDFTCIFSSTHVLSGKYSDVKNRTEKLYMI